MAVSSPSRADGTLTGTGGTSLVIGKPSGLEAGDLMVAILATDQDAGTYSLTDWVQEVRIAGVTGSIAVLYKVATSADVAASDFTFTLSVGGGYRNGSIYRVVGHNITSLVDQTSTGSGTTSAISFSGITPAANSLLFFATQNTGSGRTVSGYAIATSNPTWAEGPDQANVNLSYSVATASRPEATATGTASATMSGAGNHSEILFSIAPGADVSINAPLYEMSLFAFPTMLVNLFSITVNFLTPVVSRWSPKAKSSTAWDNEDKS